MAINFDNTAFVSDLQKFQYLDKYSRYRYDLGRRESWNETVERTVEHLKYLVDRYSNRKFSDGFWNRIYEAIFNLEVMPAMRMFSIAGKAGKRSGIGTYNCAYMPIKDFDCFKEAVLILMSGTGMGYSVENKYISQFPIVRRFDGSIVHYKFEDTTESWADGILYAIKNWWIGSEVYFDYSAIRPAGTPLKIKGGRASGSESLEKSLEKIRQIIRDIRNRNYRDNKATSLDIHDIVCSIAECIVSGGVRRSALIALFDKDDQLMLTCKDGENIVGNYQRYCSNNSAVWNEILSEKEVYDFVDTMVNGNTGEPGIFSRLAANNMLSGRREKDNEFGTNPCQPGFAKILTQKGIVEFDDIDVGSVIWSGEGWTKVVNKWSNGIKPVYKYITTAGSFIGTSNHRILSNNEKIEVLNADSLDLLQGYISVANLDLQTVMDGLMIGDGSKHLKSGEKVYLTIGKKDYDYFEDEISEYILDQHAVKYGSAWKIKTTVQPEELPHTYNRTIPDRFFYGDFSTVCSFLRGLYSANGSMVDNRVTLRATSFELIEQVQIMLSAIGIRSYYTVSKAHWVEHKNGTYLSKQSYNLNISTDRDLFARNIGFIQKYKQEKLNDSIKNVNPSQKLKSYDIINVEYLGDFPVYDITVDNNSHTYWTSCINVSNCGEIILKPFQFCNLTSVVGRSHDTIESLIIKTELATVIGTIQSLETNFPGLRDDWKINCEKERLLGVDIQGFWDCEVLRNEDTLKTLKQVAIDTNKKYVDNLGINQSVAITAIKPSGNSSSQLDTSPGIHARWSKYYIRRAQVQKESPIAKLFMDYAPAYIEPLIYAPDTTMVISFPVESPDSKFKDEISCIEQCELWKMVKLNYTEHNPSVTITYKQNEIDDLKKWIFENQAIIGGMAFLPYDDSVYNQSPYEKINKETYERMIEQMPFIDWSKLPDYEDGDYTTQTLACDSEKCELVYS